MTGDGVERDTALRHLERVLASTPFRQAERSAGLLRYLVERSLDGAGDRVKEYTIGIEALGRGKDFDPRTDPIVRAEASRLRSRLERYYASDGQSDVVAIELPKGAYTPRFRTRAMPPRAPTDEALSPVSHRQGRSHRRPMLWGAAGTFAILGAFGAGAWSARASSIARELTTRLEVQLQSDELIGSDVGTNVVIAPDGSRVVFISVDSLGASHLRMRRFDESLPSDLPGTAGARGQFWSPDSRWIGFWAAGKLRKIAVDGGSPVVLCDAPDLLGGSWGDGTIVAAIDHTKRLWKIDASGGTPPVAIVDLSAEHADPVWPQMLPGGTQVLYTAVTGVGADQASIEVVSLLDGKRKKLVEGGTFGRYLAPGHLTFVNQGTLYAERFDLPRLETHGPRVPILDDVAYTSPFGYAQISIAENGSAVYRRALPNGPLIVALVDSAGRRTPLLDTPGQYAWPALSPDGKLLALSVIESGVPSLSVFTNVQERHPRLAWTVPGVAAATWTRDGRYLVARGSRGIVWMSASGGEVRSLIENGKISVPWTFGPDDRSLAFAAMDTATVFDLWTAPIEKKGDTLRAGTPTVILHSPAFEVYPAISPDGRWLAYSSSESEPTQVYVRSLADTGVKVPIGVGGAPRWSRAGSRLFFTTKDQRIMAVGYATPGRRFVPSVPRQWTPTALGNTDVLSNYDLGPDDRYVVALVPAGSHEVQAPNHVTLLQGLSDEIRRKAP